MSYLQRSRRLERWRTYVVRLERWRAHVAWLVLVTLMAAACGDGGGEAEAAATSSTASPTTTTSTTAPAATSTTVAPTSTTAATVSSSPEPPAIELAGYTTVFSQDGRVRVSGWLDRPAEVSVGGNPIEVLDDQYEGLSTFETFLELEPGDYGIPITATDARGLQSEVFLSVLVDPALEMQLVLIDEVDLVERTVVAEYVEFLVGDEATAAAREDGVIGENEETPGGFYLRKRNPELHTLTLGDPDMVTVLACFEQGPCAAEHAVEVETWAELLANPDMAADELGWFWYGAGLAPFWLTMQDGVIVQIVEQYLP